MRSSETTIAFSTRVRAARQAGAGAARDDARSCIGGEPHDGGDVIGRRLGEHDRERAVVLGPLGVVVRVGVETRRSEMTWSARRISRSAEATGSATTAIGSARMSRL